MPMQTNVLYDGDNLDILRRYLPGAAVDVVYLDPPFATDAQLLAFEDTWHA
jgi:site-specific DNA-methyltransferase (adenine-specific)